MRAMIFAAGLGTRLRPLTDNKPKALVELNGKPLLYHCIENLKRFGVTEFMVNVHHFAQAVLRLRDEVCYCSDCMMISDEQKCSICSDRSRDHSTICVVESVRDVMSIENTGQYRGVYHVLGGIISPINGVGPSDLTIRELSSRVAELSSGNDVEVILALSGDVEGETTSFYIYRQLSQYGVRVSTLARGLGFGDDLEYADELTLGRSIINRQIFKP
jgi:recombination protein RecR